MDKKERNATLIAILAPVSWGSVPLVVHLLQHVPALLLTGLCLLLFSSVELLRQFFKKDLYPLRETPFLFHLNGVLGITGFHYFYYTAINTSPISAVFLLVNMGGVLMILYAKFFLGKNITLAHYLGITLSLIGVVFISYSKANAEHNFENPYLGYFFALLAANFWALYSVLSAKFQAIRVNATSYVCLWSGLVCLLIYFLTGGYFIALEIKDIALIVYLGLFPVGYAFYFWNHGMRFGDVSLISILAYINIIISIVLLIIFGLEELSFNLVFASVLIILGSAIATLKKSR